jgi:hypothetical protein
VLVDRHTTGIARIRPSAWCLTQLRSVAPGTLCCLDERPGRRSVGVACVAEHEDLVFVVRDQVDQTWFLVWSQVTVEVTGSLEDGQHWVVRVRGTCEREPLPHWAAPTWEPAAQAPFGLRIRDAAVCGYSVLVDEQEAG